MKKILFAFLLFTFTFSFAQSTGGVRGKILDAEMYNEPLMMATVTVKNTEWKAQTNFNGNFNIPEITPGNYTLQIRFLGYETMELPINIKSNELVEVQQSLNAKSLDFPISETNITEISSLTASETRLQKLEE